MTGNKFMSKSKIKKLHFVLWVSATCLINVTACEVSLAHWAFLLEMLCAYARGRSPEIQSL